MKVSHVAKDISNLLKMSIADVMTSWPRLSDRRCRIYRSRASGRQNCHGYALRINNWLEVSCIDRYFRHLILRGYFETTHADFESGLKKIAVYADCDDEVCHTAKQVGDGWLSKLGDGPIVFHKMPDDVGGGMYGEPIIFFAKRVKRGN